MSNDEQSDNEPNIQGFIQKISKHIQYLDSIKVLTRGKAYEIFDDYKETEKLLNSLIGLQSVFGMFISLHPESIYSQQFKQTSDIFEKVSQTAEETSTFIEATLKAWDIVKQQIKPYNKNAYFCYNILTQEFKGTEFSFHGLILRILSNCAKLSSYLENMVKGEIIKAQQSELRSRKMSETFKEQDEADEKSSQNDSIQNT